MVIFLQFLVLQLLRLVAADHISAVLPQTHAKPECRPTCGNVSIPYPFGIGPGCYQDEAFSITCNNNVPNLGGGNIVVVNINLTEGLLVVNQYMSYDCYNESGGNADVRRAFIDISDLPNYKFSDVRNKFIAVGCDTYGFIEIIDDGSKLLTGSDVTNGTCSGIGCCSAPIPKNIRSFKIALNSFGNHMQCWDFNPCSYGFVADEGWLNFSRASLTQLSSVTFVPVTLDWGIMGKTCEQAQGDESIYACVSQNSHCLNSINGPGYLCNCSKGFHGNPYLKEGCHDINECNDAVSPCVRDCKNEDGGYSCSCPWHMYGDGKRDGSGCTSILKQLYLCLGVGLSIFTAIASTSWLYWILKKKRLEEIKHKFFQQNGGTLLQQQLQGKARPATKIFSSEELRMATDDYKQSRILGEGGAGTVYRGVLPDQTVVAIKKSKITNQAEIQQFINEVIVLSHVNHRNVVKLLGCCLETQVPMLVYEFVSNGTLFYHIHDGRLSLDSRLRIASEVSGALSYLHSAASVPIIHRDIKSTNILLDENLIAKVSDFGASRLVPLDQNGLISLVRGTFGYLDPEYFQSGQFTDKSDVYSFGVVLVELLTGEKPVDMARFGDCKNLAIVFKLYVDGGCLLQILEERVVDEGTRELLEAVAELALRCLSLKGDDRPTMREVAMELEGLRRTAYVLEMLVH
ncbi:wall-associated receptor kinase 2-like [Canna indica]|uniref:Wall-associated receptor kinase 2-like n=1 Tax=Canna indica TaxID=4628 RepID=A0AAQ3PZU8_9LILI|nr:wall-associated receptor kinase 2-like [Canna indica]